MNPGGDQPDGDELVLGRYRLEEQVAAGGMGVLWRATDTVLAGTVALKRVSFAHLDSERARVTRERTLREARLAARLRGHPHVVSLFDFQVDHGDVWLVMEYLPSRNLRQVVQDNGTLSPPEAARIGAELAAALEAAHAVGIQHRDVTPGNVLIGPNGRVKLTDFGIAHSAADPRLTQDGAIVGTLPYLAPEVARDGEHSPASDVFSLGATLYFALEGRSPYEQSDNPIRMLRLVSEGVLRPATHAGPLGPLLVTLMAADPQARPSATTLLGMLHRARQHAEGPAGADGPSAWALGQAVTGTVPGSPGGAPQPDPATEFALPRRPPVPPIDRDWTTGGQRKHLSIRPAVAVAAALALVLATVLVLTNGQDDSSTTAGFLSGGAGGGSGGIGFGDVSMPVEQRTVDVCAVLQHAVAPFGTRAVRRGRPTAGCEAELTLADGSLVTVGYIATPPVNATPFPERTDGKSEGRGLTSYVNEPEKDGGKYLQCAAMVTLHDNAGFYGLAKAGNDAAQSHDLCGVLHNLNRDIAGFLLSEGVPTGRWADDYSLTDRNACELLGNKAGAIVPRLREQPRIPKLADWLCSVAAGRDAQDPSATVQFQLLTEHELSGDPKLVTMRIRGTTAYQEREDANDTCRLYLRRDAQPDARGLLQAVVVEIHEPGPVQKRCADVRTLAGGVLDSMN